MESKEAIYYLQYLRHDVHANSPYDIAIVTAINALSETKPPKTNADRIRQMTDEELSAFLGGIADNCSYNTCDNCPMYGACVDVPLSRDKWLKQEVSECRN